MQLNIKDKRVMAVAAHVDDIELGCGGSLAKFERLGAEIYYVVFSLRLNGGDEKFKKGDVLEEMAAACDILNINKGRQFVYEFHNRMFHKYRQNILQVLCDLKKQIDPDIVITHSAFDCHQDHHVVAEESFRAFKNKTILSMELFWNRSIIHKDLFIELEREDVDRKIEACQVFYTQKEFDRWIYFKKGTVIAGAVLNGAVIGKQFAECFETNRVIIR